MFIIITIISIVAITGLVWAAGKILTFKVCPICAGVSGTWIWMLIARFLGYEIELIILAILMGGSVVGIAYQIEKRLPPNRSPLLWKTFFIPAGFVAVYSIISSWWFAFIVLAILLVILAFRFTEREKSTQNSRVDDLEKEMENCC